MVKLTVESESRSVVSDSLRPHGLYSPWNPPGQNTGVGSLSLLQWIFPTQRSRESRIAGGFFTGWDIREAQGQPMRTSTHWKSPRCLERLRAEEEGIRGWEGWMALPMQCTWTWANSGRRWGTGRPSCSARSMVLQSMGSQRVGHDWTAEQQL